MTLKLTVGRVTNTLHDIEDGKIQVRALPEHVDVEEDLLPWATPFFGGYTSDTNIILNTHKVDDMMWILYEDNGLFNPCYFIPFFSLPEGFNYAALTDRLENVTDLEDFEYGSVFVELLDNGDLHFRNKENKDSVYLKDANTFVYFKGTGEIEVFTPEKEIKVHNTKGTITLSEEGDLTLALDGNTSITTKGDTSITSEGNTSITTTKDTSITTEGNTAIASKGVITVTTEDNLEATAGGDISITAGGDTTIKGASLILDSGDALPWAPNIVHNCLFTGAPHGGSTAGISNLKGAGTPPEPVEEVTA